MASPQAGPDRPGQRGARAAAGWPVPRGWRVTRLQPGTFHQQPPGDAVPDPGAPLPAETNGERHMSARGLDGSGSRPLARGARVTSEEHMGSAQSHGLQMGSRTLPGLASWVQEGGSRWQVVAWVPPGLPRAAGTDSSHRWREKIPLCLSPNSVQINIHVHVQWDSRSRRASPGLFPPATAGAAALPKLLSLLLGPQDVASCVKCPRR